MTLKILPNCQDKWVFITPISRLIVSDEIGGDIYINGVIFINKNKLIRSRVKYQTIRELNEKTPSTDSFFNSDTYAIWKGEANNKSTQNEFFKAVKLSLNLLELSQLIYGNREQNSVICVASEKNIGHVTHIAINSSKNFSYRSQTVENPSPLILDKDWKKFQKFSFFYDLLKIISPENKNISDDWKKNLINAVTLAGNSQSTRDNAYAFLQNMIAIETLLADPSDTYSKELPKRIEAFIGWSDNWLLKDLHSKMKKLYKKRCELVHSGELNSISTNDVKLSDYFLFNAFYNILKHINLFKNKKDLINFSNMIQAEKLLGITGKVRPKTLKEIGYPVEKIIEYTKIETIDDLIKFFRKNK